MSRDIMLSYGVTLSVGHSPRDRVALLLTAKNSSDRSAGTGGLAG